METRKEKLERWLKDSRETLRNLKETSDDMEVIRALTLRINDIEDELSGMHSMDYDTEALTILMEECGEVIQACSKIIRFGATIENTQQLETELGDVQALVDILHSYDMISFTNVDVACDKKKDKLKVYSNLVLD